MPTISEIQDYLKRFQKPDEEIDSKKKDRVTKQMAEQVKQNEPLQGGRCNTCGKEDDRVVPSQMKVCPTCVGKFMNRGGPLHVFSREISDYYCDNCLARTFNPMLINPNVCSECSYKLGLKHKKERKQLNKTRQKNEEKKKEYYKK